MKSAFVHCRIMPGGALNVLKDLIIEEKSKFVSLEKERGGAGSEAEGFIKPEIRIFTLVSDVQELEIYDPSSKIYHSKFKITTALPSRLNRFFLYCTSKKVPIFSSLFDYRNLIIFAPFLMKVLSRKIKKWEPEHITISSFAIAKNISVQTLQCNVSLYLHSPMQYIRSHYEEYTHKLTGRKGRLFKKITPRLRKRDKKFTQFDEVYANSHYTAKLAKEIYNIDAKVKYPLVHCHCEGNEAICMEPLPYYIYTGRLVKFVKEVDKIIELFNHTHDPLIIIGSGPDEAYLKSIAHKNIIFIDRLENSELLKILAQAKGLINLTKESFGISTAEALLLGVPVFGYDQGATPELVDQDSGILVDKKDIHTLINKFEEFKSHQRDREKIMRSIKDKLSKN